MYYDPNILWSVSFPYRMYMWCLCPESFITRRDLKYHVIPKPHAVMTVICPFCPEEKTFTKASDLKDHMDKRHHTTASCLPAQFTSERNCIWLSLKPEDYTKVCDPTDRHTTEAIKARTLVLDWLRTSKSSSKTKNQWLDGWNGKPHSHSRVVFHSSV